MKTRSCCSKRGVFHLIGFCAAWFGCAGIAQAQRLPTTQFIIKPNKGVTTDEMGTLLSNMNGTVVTNLSSRASVWQMPVTNGAALQALSGDSRIRYVEPFFGDSKLLFRPEAIPSRLSSKQKTILNRLRADNGVGSLQVTRLQHPKFIADIMSDTTAGSDDSFAVAVTSNKVVTLKKSNSTLNPDGTVTWNGVPIQGMGNATLIINGDMITGTVNLNREKYSIEPLGAGVHAVVNKQVFPPDHPPSFENVQKPKPTSLLRPLDRLINADPLRSNSQPIIRVMVAYTPQVENSVADVSALIRLAVVESNMSYTNSGVHVRLDVATVLKVNYSESGDMQKDLDSFRNSSDNVIDEVHTYRESCGADVAVLLIDDSTACGLAAAILAAPDTAFCVVHYSCATGNYSFAHEVGHLMGARHNVEADTNNVPFAYGHGFWKKGEWRCVMSLPKPCNCIRIPYWSNPDVIYQGSPMGSKESQNNTRVLNETAETVAAFR